jgi:hypothetical protein
MVHRRFGARGRDRAHRVVAVGMAVLLLGAGAPATARAAPADPAGLTGTPLTPDGSESGPKAATSRLAESDPAVLAATGPDRVPVLVTLDYDSVATYAGGVADLAGTASYQFTVQGATTQGTVTSTLVSSQDAQPRLPGTSVDVETITVTRR